MGTSSDFSNARPKKYATAEKVGTVAGVHDCQTPATSVCGDGDSRRATVNSRILGCAAAAISCSAFADRRTDQPMFDWPEQSHTSPTSTLWNVIVRSAGTVSSNGPPAF